ncbi:hypothetical protein ACH5RR_000483 [Cinchona calisaya]|uniref:Uncharacterized protein n=1 Tax=Cinchona calisaya TaxID=153742 RepID=A0ABD3B1U7_9GENT
MVIAPEPIPPLPVNLDHWGVEPEQEKDIDDVSVADEHEQEPLPVQPRHDQHRRSTRDWRHPNKCLSLTELNRAKSNS